MKLAKALYEAYVKSEYYKFLPTSIEDAKAFINANPDRAMNESVVMLVEYFYEWLLDSWTAE